MLVLSRPTWAIFDTNLQWRVTALMITEFILDTGGSKYNNIQNEHLEIPEIIYFHPHSGYHHPNLSSMVPH